MSASSALKSRLACIGGGMMAEAILRGLLEKGIATPENLVASDPVEARRVYLQKELGIAATATNLEAIQGAQIVLFAVKPQTIGDVLTELKGKLNPNILVMTIVTGAKIAAYQQALGTPAIARIMPNTPAQIGEGISVWTATSAVSAEQRQQAAAILTALGPEIYVQDEDYLDKATALSGSGPAYVFLFIEALIDAGVHIGFPRPVAEQLALQTVRGSAIYAQQSGEHPAILRNRVTSPAGTTADALLEFEQGGLRATVLRAVLAAYHRAQALGEAKSS